MLQAMFQWKKFSGAEVSREEIVCLSYSVANNKTYEWVHGEYFTPKTIGLAAAVVYNLGIIYIYHP